MGYEDFEIYGFDDRKVTYYGIDASEFKQQLDDLELSVTSGHYGFASYLSESEDELKRFVDQCILGAKALNSPYITWPWIAPEQRNIETFKLLAKKTHPDHSGQSQHEAFLDLMCCYQVLNQAPFVEKFITELNEIYDI